MHGNKHYTLTLNGTAQLLSEVLGGGASDLDIPCDVIMLEPDGANANRVYVGGTNATLTSSAYGFSLPPGSSGAPPPPFLLPLGGRAGRLSQYKVLGTDTQKLHIFVIER